MDIISKLHPLERKLLPHLDDLSFEELVERSKMKDVEVMRALQWMSNKDILNIHTVEEEVFELGKNGKLYKKEGLPEKRFLAALPATLKEIPEKAGLERSEVNVSIGLLKRNGYIDMEKGKQLRFTLTPKGKKYLETKSDEEKLLEKDFPLRKLNKEEKEAAKNLLDRKDILNSNIIKLRTIDLTKLGKKLAREDIGNIKVVDRITQDMLKDGSWKNKEFRQYDVEINVPAIHGGKQHFTRQVADYIKDIWVDLGFKEMTGNIVQTSFWDLDALFVPQDHPARDMQDTFYLEDPKEGKLPNIANKVRKTHEDGWTTGSKGWRYDWDKETAERNLLRTHTTVLSAQTISKLKKEDLPAKFFAVGKNFRNETLDWKHLFEFYQVEGIVVDPDANFSNLVAYLKLFFKKMGFPDARIRPGHFPYTEPSAEVDVWHPKKKEWVELGGAGIFRPEVTKPLMGFEVPVLAWGLGLGRMFKEYWDINDMRDLYKNDLKQLRDMKMWL